MPSPLAQFTDFTGDNCMSCTYTKQEHIYDINANNNNNNNNNNKIIIIIIISVVMITC